MSLKMIIHTPDEMAEKVGFCQRPLTLKSFIILKLFGAWSFGQLAIALICRLSSFSLHQLAISSACQSIYLPICQLAIS
jgi:hypothetical protein